MGEWMPGWDLQLICLPIPVTGGPHVTWYTEQSAYCREPTQHTKRQTGPTSAPFWGFRESCLCGPQAVMWSEAPWQAEGLHSSLT